MPRLRRPAGAAAAAAAALAVLAGPAPASALYINGSVIAPCDSPLYCYGEILEQVQLAKPFSDSKTFVDMPARKPLPDIQAAFDSLPKPLKNDSVLNDFLQAHFGPAGDELDEPPRDTLTTDPLFLAKLQDPVVREFVGKVIDIWPDLTRSYDAANASTAAASSFIPVNRTFVVAGGRFREPYYWDSFWIVEGLLRTRGAFTQVARNTIDNFLDFVERFGFVPNGARVYYLNRSQPPLLAQMVRVYLQYTNDTSILDRAVPLLVREHDFWTRNRSVDVRVADCTYSLARYAVANNQPRPESFLEDYETVTNASYYPTTARGGPFNQTASLNDSERAALYADLATTAESGWDFSSRWLARPEDSIKDDYFPLRSLNTHNIIPVDLNAILYANERAIGDFHALAGNDSACAHWHERAQQRSRGMHALLWNESFFGYFDYNITSGSQHVFVPLDDDADPVADIAGAPPGQQVYFHPAQFFPFWLGAAPAHLRHEPETLLRAYARVARYLDLRPGGLPATNLQTNQQWDQPNVWPPLQYALIKGLHDLPPRVDAANATASASVRALALRIAQRYLDSTFCTWYATGGSTSETPKLAGLTDADVGIMFEKYNDNATNVAGGGGEYEVVEGFGWTNGILIWAADTFGNDLKRPDCGDIKAATGGQSKRSALLLHKRDASRIKKFGRRATTAKRNLY